MKSLLAFLLLLAYATATISLADVEDTALGALLSNNWQALLPQDLANTRTQLIKILTPAPTTPAPTTSPQHFSSRSHARLARAGSNTHEGVYRQEWLRFWFKSSWLSLKACSMIGMLEYRKVVFCLFSFHQFQKKWCLKLIRIYFP
jgi:hypothetical protein